MSLKALLCKIMSWIITVWWYLWIFLPISAHHINGLTLCFLVTVSFPATTLTSSHSSFLFLTFVFSPWNFYSIGQKSIIIIIIIIIDNLYGAVTWRSHYKGTFAASVWNPSQMFYVRCTGSGVAITSNNAQWKKAGMKVSVCCWEILYNRRMNEIWIDVKL